MFGLATNPRRKRRKGRGRRVSANRRRRSHRRRNPLYRGRSGRFSSPPTFGTASGRRLKTLRRQGGGGWHNPHRRRRHSNPSIAAQGTRSIMAGFKPSAVMGVVPIAAGALGNHFLSNMVASRLPASLQGRWTHPITSVATAGILSAGVGMANKRWAGPVFAGGMVQAVVELYGAFQPTIKAAMKGLGLDLDDTGLEGLEGDGDSGGQDSRFAPEETVEAVW